MFYLTHEKDKAADEHVLYQSKSSLKIIHNTLFMCFSWVWFAETLM